MNQEDLIKKIRQSAQDVAVPDCLSPEQMGKRLKQKRPMRPPVWRYGAVAAVGVIALSVWGNQTFLKTQVAVPVEQGSIAYKETESAAPTTGALADPEDYDSVYEAILPFMDVPQFEEAGAPAAGVIELGKEKEQAVADKNALLSESSEVARAMPDMSATNTQVAGVDEGDVVKTDGSCIYTVGEEGHSIRLVTVGSDGVKKAGRIQARGGIREFYISGSNLIAISEVYLENTIPSTKKNNMARCGVGYMRTQTIAETFDISDKDNPKLTGTVTQDGGYQSSRMRNGYLYMFTLYWPELEARLEQPDQYIPKVNEMLLPPSKVMLPDHIYQEAMLVMSAVDLNKPSEAADMTAIVSGGDIFYVSSENIYVGNNVYDRDAHQYNYTELLKYSYGEGSITYKTKTNVDGSLNNQFSLDEHNGYLRVVSTLDDTEGKQTNSLYIFDKDLNMTGSVEGLAPGEQIYSARFMGDIAYFVTYRNTDPLFAADVSNPSKPRILGELKITGFSNYLQPFSETLLLGIGQETDPVTGNFKGLKLSMFDIADPVNVTEQDKLVEAGFEYSPAWYNHKAVLVSSTRNLVGLAVNDYNKKSRLWEYRYVIYSYDEENGFTQKLDHKTGELDIENIRGIYIDNYCYVVETDRITSYSMENFSQHQQLIY